MINQNKYIPILQSLTRPILVLGGERENMIILACLCLSLVTVGRDLLSLVLGVLLWSIGLLASKIFAKADPWATKIFLRSLSYRDFYHARERINTPVCAIKRNRKI